MKKLLALCIGLVLWSCASVGPQGSLVPGSVLPAPYAVELQYSSDVPDDYYMLSGPVQTYERYRVNDPLRAGLEEYARRKSGPGSAEKAVLRFRLVAVNTQFESAVASGGPVRGAVLPSYVIRYSSAEGYPRPFTKRASLTAVLEIDVHGAVVHSERFTVESEATTGRYEIDHWSYDYSDVLGGAMGLAVEAVDRMVSRALSRTPGR